MMPPIMPPTIAPTGVLCFVLDAALAAVLDALDVAGGVVDSEVEDVRGLDVRCTVLTIR